MFKISFTVALSANFILFAPCLAIQQDGVAELRRKVDSFIYGDKPNKTKAERISSARAIEDTLRKNRSKYTDEDYFKLAGDLAHYFYTAGENRLAIESYQHIAESAEDELVRAGALSMLGWLHFGSKDSFPEAIKYFEPSIELLNNYPNKNDPTRNELAGRTIVTLANLYKYGDNQDRAIELYQSVLANENYVAAADKSTLIGAASNLARMHKKSDPETATRYYLLLDELVSSSEISEDMKIGFLTESFSFAARHGKTSENRILALEKMLGAGRTNQDVNTSNILARARLANALCLLYYTRQKEDKSYEQKLAKLSKRLFDQLATLIPNMKAGEEKKNN